MVGQVGGKRDVGLLLVGGVARLDEVPRIGRRGIVAREVRGEDAGRPGGVTLTTAGAPGAVQPGFAAATPGQAAKAEEADGEKPPLAIRLIGIAPTPRCRGSW